MKDGAFAWVPADTNPAAVATELWDLCCLRSSRWRKAWAMGAFELGAQARAHAAEREKQVLQASAMNSFASKLEVLDVEEERGGGCQERVCIGCEP